MYRQSKKKYVKQERGMDLGPVIVIDPGHGGSDPGATGFGLQEKNINLDIAQRVRNKLGNFADVNLTRNSDVFISLSDRAAYANRAGADLFVSLHVNAGGGTGFESYVYPDASSGTRDITRDIYETMSGFYRSKGFPARGFKEANFAVLRETDMSALLLENLFIDNQKDADMLKLPEFRAEIAGEIAGGIIKALNLVEAPQPQEPGHWAAEYFKRLQDAGLVNSEHNLDSGVTWGEFSAVVIRLMDRNSL